MLIVGAGACARDLLAMLEMNGAGEDFVFYDDFTPNQVDFLYKKYTILKNKTHAKNYFNKNKKYAVAIGKPNLRYEMMQQFDALGGEFISLISRDAQIGLHSTISDRGVIIMHGNIITNEVSIGEGSLINMRCTLGHFCKIGRYCVLAPGVFASTSSIGDFSLLGIGVIVKPEVNIGKNVIVGAGAVVTRDVPDNWIVAGNPAVKIGEQEPVKQ